MNMVFQKLLCVFVSSFSNPAQQPNSAPRVLSGLAARACWGQVGGKKRGSFSLASVGTEEAMG